MEETRTPENAKTNTGNVTDAAINGLEKILPLANGLNKTLQRFLLLGLVSVLWLFVYFWQFLGWGLPYAGGIAAFLALFLIVPALFLYAVSEVVALPERLQEVRSDASTTAQKFSAARQTTEKKKRAKASALFELGKLLANSGGLYADYASFGILLNPIMLIIGAVCMAVILLLLIVAAIVALVAIF